MNARILELLKDPDQLQQEDLKSLREAISQRPYQQSLRALHLYGTHKFAPENYQTELSTVAAFTTDKKNLYRFINRNIKEIITEETLPKPVENEVKTVEPAENIEEKDPKAAVFTELYEPKETEAEPVFVNGERNRILFTGEEDFLEREGQKIDLEQTLESGTIVTDRIEQQIFADEIKEEKPPEEHSDTVEIPEKDIPTEEIKTEHPVVEGEKELESAPVEAIAPAEENSELSFSAIDNFLPEVNIAAPDVKENFVAPKTEVNRHEEEMKRLIAEVEAKMKKNRAEKKPSEPEKEILTNNNINFSENMPSEDADIQDQSEQNSAEDEQISELPNKSDEKTENTWRPLNFDNNKNDSLIAASSENVEQQTEHLASIEAEEQVMNISFFTPNVEPIAEESQVEMATEIIPEEKSSNVPTFINTWQNWLKIDHSAQKKIEKIAVSKADEKTKVIDKFIETQPKISKLKEDSNFVVKEKTQDISHLMTETLANLYTEQRLYTKAIKAYEVLMKKHPEKSEQFAERISEIKELRQGK